MKNILTVAVRHSKRKLLASHFLGSGVKGGVTKWAIVGTGYMASVWADLLLESKIGILHSVCSRSAQKAESFRRRFGCEKAYGLLDDMLSDIADELDFVYIATPLASHAHLIRKCILAGVNILSEKPATETADAWAELSGLAKQHGVLLLEGMWMRCLPTFGQANTWINDGKIGDIRWIRADLHKFQLTPLVDHTSEDGVLMDYGIYALSFASHFLGGSPNWCNSYGRSTQVGADCDLSIVAGRDGKIAVINLSSNLNATSGAAVIGQKGMIEWGSPFNRTNKISLHDFETLERKSMNFTYRHMGFEFQLEEVTRCLKDGRPESQILSHQSTLDTLNFAGQVQAALDRQQGNRV